MKADRPAAYFSRLERPDTVILYVATAALQAGLRRWHNHVREREALSTSCAPRGGSMDASATQFDNVRDPIRAKGLSGSHLRKRVMKSP